jgi:acetylornithine deacetylase/succinyl-diaminopimelate desuccinylase-like protein
MSDYARALDYARSRRTTALDELKELIRIPSISTLPEWKPDVLRAAEWVAQRLQAYGLKKVGVLDTKGHPVVYGEWKSAGDRPMVLVYGHYDVQPVDPIDLWKSEPFDPVQRGDDLFGRGASDMKGQLVALLQAVEAMIRSDGLPVNLRFLIEGEEEVGSPNLQAFMVEHREQLTCDFCLNTDSSILAPDLPAITYGVRGLAYFELRVQAATTDLHSGMFGGAVDNPALVLCQVVGGMRDAKGRVTLPGFYDSVQPLAPEEREEIARQPQGDAWWKAQTGAPALFGEDGFTASERVAGRPTFDVNGLLSGFTGKGSKTVLPARAMAKISTRLVPDQTPAMVRKALEAYLQKHMPPTVTWELEDLAHSLPAIVDRDSAPVRAASAALEDVWGTKPVLTRTGGTIPIVGLVQEVLGSDSLLLGFGLPDDNLHAPNEKMHLPNFYRGIETYIRFLHRIAA